MRLEDWNQVRQVADILESAPDIHQRRTGYMSYGAGANNVGAAFICLEPPFSRKGDGARETLLVTFL